MSRITLEGGVLEIGYIEENEIDMNRWGQEILPP